MSNHVKPIGVALGTALLGSISLGQLAVASDGFKAADLGSGYAVAMAGDKAKEGKCGEGKCGFSKLDTNGDGTITAAEWTAAKPDKADKWKALDADGDGKVTQAEWDAAHKGKEGKCGEGKCGSKKS